jgi:signal transduction histidine kinase
MGDHPDLQRLNKRLERERKARAEAEEIAERVTAQLYASQSELKRVNTALGETNDELQAANQSLRDFVAVASHDLRSPLTAMLGWATTLLSRWEVLGDDRKRTAIETIENNGRRLARLIDELLTISTIESGALTTKAEVVRFREAIESVAETFSERAAEITFDYPEELLLFVDADHLQRILTNYVGNALKYGAPPVIVEAAETPDSVVIRVRDCGPGVPQDFVPRLFGKFSRGEDENTRSKPGTGLGLSIVRGLVEANGGETWYEPNLPQGSCFAVRLLKVA